MTRISLLFKASMLFLFGMPVLVFVGPILDFFSTDVAHILGWINNTTMAWTLLYLGLVLFALPDLSERREWICSAGLLALFAAALAWTVHWAQDPIVQIGGMLALGGAAGAGLVSYALSRAGRPYPRRLVWAIALAVPALPIAPVLIAIAPDAYDSFMLKVYGFSNVRVVGYFTGGLSGLLGAIVLHPATRARDQVLVAVALCITVAVMFWSGSRGALVAFAVGLALAMLILRRLSLRGMCLSAAATCGGALASTVMHLPGPTFGIIDRVARNADAVRTASDAGGTVADAARAVSTNRMDLWEWAFDRIMQAPLTGYGYLPMSWMREEPFNYYHTHNIVLEYWISFGLIAGTVLLGVGVWAWIRAASAARRIDTPAAAGLLAFATILPIHACVSAALFFPYHLLLFAMALGALIGWDVSNREDAAHRDARDAAFKPRADWMMEDP